MWSRPARTIGVVSALAIAVLSGVAARGAVGRDECDDARAQQRRVWEVSAPSREQAPTLDGLRVTHWPTATLGVWVVEVAQSTMTRVSPTAITAVQWDARCATTTETRPRPSPPPPRFTDGDLAARVQTPGRGAVYVWSPHMPLSVDAVSTVVEAARLRDLSVDLVLHPEADRQFAARIAADRGLPASALRVVDSVELLFREVLVHAPAVQAYAGGRLLGSPFPGAHTLSEYDAYFARVLSRPE